MCRFLFLLLVFSIFSTVVVYSETMDYAFSSYALQKLVAEEQKLIPAILKYLEATESKLELIRDYIEEAEDSVFKHSKALLKIGNTTVLDSDLLLHEVSAHPLKSFRMLLRLAGHVDEILGELNRTAETELLTAIKQSKKELPFPTQKDEYDSQESILRLIETYNLSARKLITGNLNGIETNSGLNPTTAFEMGYYAMRRQMFTLAMDLFDACLEIASGDEKLIRRIKKAVNFAIRKHDENLSTGQHQKEINPFHFKQPLIDVDNDAYRNKEPISIPEFLQENSNRTDSETFVTMNNQLAFEEICQGKDFRAPNETKHLKCILVSNTHPFYRLQPLQVEVKSLNPEVLQIYNVLTDREMALLRVETEPKLVRSLVFAVNESDQIDSGRTSSNTWIPDFEPQNPFNFMAHRIERITGLQVVQMSGTEMLQVANYMPGGFYGPHFDASDNLDEMIPFSHYHYDTRGDRIATFMIYLSEVQMGGGTAFPKLGFGVQPIKGSAIFWYNLRSDGSLDPKSLHGGCPLLHGLKYIANKWIRSNDQMFRRKCTTLP